MSEWVEDTFLFPLWADMTPHQKEKYLALVANYSLVPDSEMVSYFTPCGIALTVRYYETQE